MAFQRDFTADDQLFIGDDIRLIFEVFQDDLVVDDDGNYVSGTPEDVTGWGLVFMVRFSDTTPVEPLITKSTLSGITITGTYDAIRASNTQRVEVSILDTDTWSDDPAGLRLKPKNYKHSLKRTDPGSEKVICFGLFVLREVPTRD